MLEGVGEAIKGLSRPIRVEGHTDSLTYRKGGIGNWELSALRAVTVTNYFLSQMNFNTENIYAAAYGPSRPIATNDTPENRMLNRRVDIKVLYDSPKDYENLPATYDNLGRNE
jgi:chemotaxis protein MotB